MGEHVVGRRLCLFVSTDDYVIGARARTLSSGAEVSCPGQSPLLHPHAAIADWHYGGGDRVAAGRGDRRTLFDIAITGPLAGFVPASLFSVVGLHWSHVVVDADQRTQLMLGEPIIFKLLAYLAFGSLPEGQDIALHPVAFAGWVGIFITALKLRYDD